MHRFKVPIALLTIFFVSVLTWNCTKIDTTTLGSGLIPPVDNVNTFDTLISVTAINYDSATTTCDTLYRHSDHALGYISNDPRFGKTTAGIYLELKPSSFPFSFPNKKDSIFGDSVVLELQYKKSFGDSTVPQKVNAYLLQGTSFKIDTTYTSCFSAPYFGTPFGSKIFTPARLRDTVKVLGDTSINELRIKLKDQFAQSLFAQDSSTWFKNDSTFRKNIPGFALFPDASFGGNALNYFNLDSPRTRLALYYRYMLAGKLDTGITYFTFNNLTGEANQIVRDRSGADIAGHLSHNPLGDDQVYIQTSPGSFANLKIPGLNSLSNRVILRADLIMQSLPLIPSDPFATPDILYIQTKDSSLQGQYHPIPCDFVPSGNIRDFGGFRNVVKDNFGNTISQYDFNITRYIQNFVTRGRTQMDLRLSAPTHIFNFTAYQDYCGQVVIPFNIPYNGNGEGRVILGGGNNSNYRMKLRIIYSKL